LQASYHSRVKGTVLPQGCRLASGGTSVTFIPLAHAGTHRHQFKPAMGIGCSYHDASEVLGPLT
jgi:hypothetical protein